MALSTVLLVGAGLFVKSLSRATVTDLGFDAEDLAVVYLQSTEGTERTRRNEIYREALERSRVHPGVSSAFLASETIPFLGWNEQWGMRASAIDSIPRVADGGPYTYSGTEGFVETLGLRVVEGRSFATSEYRRGGPPVVMVSRSFARTVWPGRDPLGECVTLEYDPVEDAGPEPCRPVVGVYADLALRALSDTGLLSVAWPTPPDVSAVNGLVLRIEGDRAGVLGALREELQGISSEVRFVRVAELDNRVADMLGPWRVGSAMFVAFGALALLVASLGLYSVLAFRAARRRREMGIRAALGAHRTDLVHMIVRDGVILVLAGLGLGACLALAAGRILQDVLFAVSATDPSVFTVVAISLLGSAVAASLVPAWQASRVHPTTALSEE